MDLNLKWAGPFFSSVSMMLVWIASQLHSGFNWRSKYPAVWKWLRQLLRMNKCLHAVNQHSAPHVHVNWQGLRLSHKLPIFLLAHIKTSLFSLFRKLLTTDLPHEVQYLVWAPAGHKLVSYADKNDMICFILVRCVLILSHEVQYSMLWHLTVCLTIRTYQNVMTLQCL